MRIGVYGGAFNPPHPGHIRLAEKAKQLLCLDKLLLVPTGDPPHKTLPEGSPGSWQRYEMLNAAVRGIDAASSLEGIYVSDIEINREGKSYTADTLESISAEYPDSEIFLIMGMDMFLSFDKWHEPERICRRCTLAPSYRSKKDMKKAGTIDAQKKKLMELFSASVELIPIDFIEASSTAARIMLVFGCAEGYLDPAVMEYIKENKLYQPSRDLKNLSTDELREYGITLVDEKRVSHVLGCEQTAAKLANHWDEDEDDARRAAILHDCTKALKLREQLILCEKYGIITDMLEKSQDSLLHSKTGATVAEHIFGESRRVCDAIATHTTGSEDMSLLQKIIYIADYIEPNRKLDGVDELRALAYEDIDKAMLMGLNMTIESLKEKGKPVHPRALAAIDMLGVRLSLGGLSPSDKKS